MYTLCAKELPSWLYSLKKHRYPMSCLQEFYCRIVYLKRKKMKQPNFMKTYMHTKQYDTMLMYTVKIRTSYIICKA